MGADYDLAGRLRLLPARLLAGCYLDLGHRIDDTTLVVGTGRSGSTWVAEVVNQAEDHRLVFEPFRADRVRRARLIRRGHYLHPSEQDDPLAGTIDALLAGRVRGWWTDRQNRCRIARRRIVKSVRATNLIPWIRARHPGLRIVYVVRDPTAVARSWLELGWGDDLDEVRGQPRLLERLAGARPTIEAVAAEGEPLERHVLRWCLENAIPLRAAAELDVHLVEYERLRDDPEREIDRLFAYLGRDPGRAHDSARRPSATAAFPRRRVVTLGEDDLRRADEIVASFGLADLVRSRTGARRA